MEQENIDLKKKKILKYVFDMFYTNCFLVLFAIQFTPEIMLYLSKFDSTYITNENFYGLLAVYFSLSTILMIKAYLNLKKSPKNEK